MQNKTKLVFLLSVTAFLMVFSNVLAITEEYNPISGADTTEVYYNFNSGDISNFQNSDDNKYVIQGSWPDGDFDNDTYLVWDDFGIEVPECIDVNDVTLKFEWTKVGCMNIRAARIFINIDSEWIEIWSKNSNLPTSDYIEVIDLTPYISDAQDLENLQVKFDAWANLYGYSHHDWVELVVDYDECPTHTECGDGYCMEVYGEGEDECTEDIQCRHNFCDFQQAQCDTSYDNEPGLPDECTTFIPDCGECVDDSDCDYLDDDYCDSDLVKHDEGVCNLDTYTCEVQTNEVEDCFFVDKYCEGSSIKEDLGYCDAAQCHTQTTTIDECYFLDTYCEGDLIKQDEGYCENALCETDTTTVEDCNDYDLDPIGTCFYIPDGIDYTWDSFAGFDATCDPGTVQCTQGQVELTHECDITNCGAECEEDSDCECPTSGCVGRDWYEYPAYGECLDDCTCDLDETPCNGPCKPTIITDDERCTHYVCNDNQQQCELVEGEGTDECSTYNDCVHDICNYNTLTCDTVPLDQQGDSCSLDTDCYHTECNYDLEQCVDVAYDDTDECTTFLPDCGECITDSDCDNGLFCDGQEMCVDNFCQPSTAPCVYWVDECTEVSCDEINDQCVETPIADCCIDDSDCDYLDDNYCNCCTGNFRMHDEGVCEDNECTVQTTTLEHCDDYDAWDYGDWDIFTCYKTRDNEYKDYSCFEENDETYCDYEITDTETETENINEGIVCNMGDTTCKDTCTIGQEQYTCQSGECLFDIWTNLVDTNPFSCIAGQTNGCSEACGAECDEDSDCECEGEDGCIGTDYYDYPEYGICESDCTCNTDDAPCQGPCKPTIYYQDERCYTCVDEDEDGYYAIDPNCPEGDDCDDNNEYVYPGATEWCCDGIDNDCDELIDCQDPDCGGPCEQDDDNDGVPDYRDDCIGENQQNLPQDTICRDWFFNTENGCHDYINDDGSTVCETTEDSYYTCEEGDVYYVSGGTTKYCGVDTGYCDGEETGASSMSLYRDCEENQYCVEGDSYCHTNNNNQEQDEEPKEEPEPQKTSKKLSKGTSKGQSDFNVECGDGFCVIPQEIEEGYYFCPEDCGLLSWYQFN